MQPARNWERHFPRTKRVLNSRHLYTDPKVMGCKAKGRLNQVVHHQHKRRAVPGGSFSCPDGSSAHHALMS